MNDKFWRKAGDVNENHDTWVIYILCCVVFWVIGLPISAVSPPVVSKYVIVFILSVPLITLFSIKGLGLIANYKLKPLDDLERI